MLLACQKAAVVVFCVQVWQGLAVLSEQRSSMSRNSMGPGLPVILGSSRETP